MIAQVDSAYWRAARLRTGRRFLSYSLFEGRPATTRGQWINPAVMLHLQAAAAAVRLDTVDRPMFIVGMGRSGTTLLGRILGVHRDVGFLNEPKALWHTIDSREDVSGFYGKAGGRFRLDAADATIEVVGRARRLFHYYGAVTRCSRVADKYPELTYRRQYIRAIFPDACIIGLVRRPEAVASSIVTWCQRNSRDGQDWWGVGGRKWDLLWGEFVQHDERRYEVFGDISKESASTRDRAVVEWIIAMDELTKQRSADDSVDLLVRYEDLTDDPCATIELICRTAGLAESPEMVRFAREVVRSSRAVKSGGASGSPLMQRELDRLTSVLGY